MGTACRFGCTLSFVSLVLGCFCKVPAFPVDVRIVPTMRVDAASKKVCQGRVVSSSWQTSKVVSSRGRPTFKSSALRGRVTCLATLEAQDLSKLEKYSPLGERYLVTKFEREAKTDGGILLAQTAAENQSKGENLLRQVWSQRGNRGGHARLLCESNGGSRNGGVNVNEQSVKGVINQERHAARTNSRARDRQTDRQRDRDRCCYR